MSRSFPLSLTVIATLLVPAGVSAQITIATLSGAIRDQSGAPIPGASITITNQETGATIQAVSDGEGGYRLTLTPARYSVDVGLEGFEAVTRRVALAAGQLTPI